MKTSIQLTPLAKRQLSTLGENLRLARLRRNLSLRAIALRAGISVNSVVKAESGEESVSLSVVLNILHALGLVEDISKVAADDELGRKLQDIELARKKRTKSRSTKSHTSQDI